MLNSRYFINKFPKIELSDDIILHRKVHTDMYMLIPQGIRIFAWFTYYQNQNLCVIMHLNKYNQIIKAEETCLCFNKILSYGTIIYGTYFNYNNMRFITCEDIYYYKGDMIQEKCYIDRFKILEKIFNSELQQKAYSRNFTIFGLPYITDNLKTAFANINLMPYHIKGVLFRNWNKEKEHGILLNTQVKPKDCLFKIKATVTQDIYNLYCKGRDGDNDFYGYVCIPDYKTSVIMNQHFRKIKENTNLDFLEMSDDEEEFENINEDKFVNLKTVIYMRCIYMKKFQKWKPVEVVKFGEKLLDKERNSTIRIKG